MDEVCKIESNRVDNSGGTKAFASKNTYSAEDGLFSMAAARLSTLPRRIFLFESNLAITQTKLHLREIHITNNLCFSFYHISNYSSL